MRLRQSFAILLALGMPVLALADEGHQHHHAGGEPEKLGKVDFPVSCKKAAQETFGRAVALLHSFWYDEAETTFTEVTRLDPKCAMGHWGVAMSNYHPIWAPPTPAELERGKAAVARAKATAVKTDRERDYIAAIEAYYKDSETLDHPARKLAYEKAMEQVSAKYPQDREAATFYALALLGTAPPTDKSYVKQRKAGELLNKVLPAAPEHPGVAHYLIHSFDYPQLAEIGLPAARVYSKIAASSPHALHMPSHIFTRLALWDDSIQSNLASAATAKRHLEKTKPGASSFDELHAVDYLAYAYLQQARDDKARELREAVAKVGEMDLPNFAAAYALAAVPARYTLERRQWKEAAALTVQPAGFPWAKFPYAEALVHFARAIGGARSGDPGAARAGATRLAELHRTLSAAKEVFWAGQLAIQLRAADAWIAFAEGRKEEALTLMRAAAELEDMTDKHPVTPGSVLPARELLADMLAEMGRPADALKEYEVSLQTAPGRFNSLAGAVRAADSAGDEGKAKALFAKIEELCAKSDGTRPELVALRSARRAGH
jgi:tetratricopeptide (TPR) repeat protein